MSTAKDLRVAPIKSSDAITLVKRLHYSGKVAQNSQLHLGVFLNGRLEGAMQFGPPLDKRRSIGLVSGTQWNGFLELNRMAFSSVLPRNSESRALAVAFRMIRKAYPHIEWVQSFADGCQCGDGAIYRASGFVLTAITPNKTIIEFPDGTRLADIVTRDSWDGSTMRDLCRRMNVPLKPRSIAEWKALGVKEVPGFQLRYVYFLNPSARERLTVPILPFSKVDEMGAGMYRGQKVSRTKWQAAENHSALGGSTPTRALHSSPPDADS